MKKIIMIDLWSVSDDNGNPIGHGGKVGIEYYEYIKNVYDVEQFVNESMLKHFEKQNVNRLPYSLNIKDNKICRIFKYLKNIKYLYKKYEKDIFWFYIPNIYIFLIIPFLKKKDRKIVSVVYEDYSNNKIKSMIFRYALKKIDLVFATNKYLSEQVNNSVLVPDYTYDCNKFKRYVPETKSEYAVCLGTMNEKKLLLDAVNAFANNGYPLYIVGIFQSNDLYEELIKRKTSNIVIENRFVENEEYYRLLGESKYCLIPYDPNFYKNRTSGVIQECIFFESVPITCKSILNFSKVLGVGYDRIEELKTIDFLMIETEMIKSKNNKYRDEFHNKQYVIQKVREGFESLY